jgi:hypothetical protein
MQMKKVFILMGLMMVCTIVFGLTLNFRVNPSGWSKDLKDNNGAPFLDEGVPAMNYLPIRVLIPFGEKIENVQVLLSEPEIQREQIVLDYVRKVQIISQPQSDTSIPNPEIWNKDALFPIEDYKYLGTQMYSGLQIAVIDIYPWKYNPVQKTIFTSNNVTLQIETSWDDELAEHSANFYAPNRNFSDLTNFVLNPETISTYQNAPLYRTHQPQSRLIDLSIPKKMIIITNSASASYFQNYIEWQNTRSISTGLYLTSDIYSSYDGIDNAEKIRNFISDAYQTWSSTSTPLEYVILGGDDEIVPDRGCFCEVGETVDFRIPTDIYYSNLDGNWNADGDQIWGETDDQVDYIPEVHISRFPAETANEFNNMTRKIQYYVNNDTYSNNLAIMFGENLNNNPLTWGGDYKDDVASHIPDDYFLSTRYQRDGTFSSIGVWNALNDGANVMNHMGHSNETSLMGQGSGSVEQLQNTEYGFLYTQGCYPAAFDQRTSGDGECIGEHLVTTSGGLFSFIGNTRYGWYMPGSINGPSQFYDRQFFIGLYEANQTNFGKALTYSRFQNMNAAINYDVMRWCYYEMVLFGDPTIEVKYPDPTLPLLSLEGYSISDLEGDGDGSFNPGEILRIYPIIKNAANFGTAYNISVSLQNLPQGVTLLDGPQVIPQILPGATCDPSFYFRIQLAEELNYGIYYLKLVLDSTHAITGLSTGIRKFDLSFEITMVDSHFPWDSLIHTKSAPIVYDLNNDGNLDILYLNVFGQAHYINNNGDEFGGFTISPQQDVMRSSALGDINGDGTPEIIYSSRTGKINAIDINGTSILSYDAGNYLIFTPVIATLDHSGIDKVITHSLNGYVYALNSDGLLLSGFPVNLGSSIQTEIAAADLDEDGVMEIIIGCQNGSLHILNAAGVDITGFPINIGENINGAPTVLDNSKIVFGTNNHMLLLSSTGEILVNKPIVAAMANSPVVADLTGDGALEIIFVTINGMLYVTDQNGNDLNGFPVNVGDNFNAPPLIFNLDEDIAPEILLTSYQNSLYAYNNDGTMLPGYPFITSFNGCTPATVCDLNNDDILKLISGYSTGVVVMNLRRPDTEIKPWITYRGALNRQGSFACTNYVSNSDPYLTPQVNRLEQNYPNPFRQNTTILYETKKEGKINLSIYNLRGQLIRTLEEGYISSGKHSIDWDGKDSRGRTVANGIYLCRLKTPETTLTRRMLLCK